MYEKFYKDRWREADCLPPVFSFGYFLLGLGPKKDGDLFCGTVKDGHVYYEQLNSKEGVIRHGGGNYGQFYMGMFLFHHNR